MASPAPSDPRRSESPYELRPQRGVVVTLTQLIQHARNYSSHPVSSISTGDLHIFDRSILALSNNEYCNRRFDTVVMERELAEQEASDAGSVINIIMGGRQFSYKRAERVGDGICYRVMTEGCVTYASIVRAFFILKIT